MTVGFLMLLALLALLLYKFRRSAAVQRLLAPFSRCIGSRGGFQRVGTPGPEDVTASLINPSTGGPATMPTAAASAAAGAATAGRSRLETRYSPAMRELSPPLLASSTHAPETAAAVTAAAVAPATRDSNRVSVFSDVSASSGDFIPSPVSPVAPPSVLWSPGTVQTARPVEEPPDPRVAESTHGRLSRGSFSTYSMGDVSMGGGDVGAEALLAWPLPAGPTPVSRQGQEAGDGSSPYLDFDSSGERTVRIHQGSGGF